MNEYRLHIDIPLGQDEDKAIEITQQMISTIAQHVRLRAAINNQITGMNYRLGHDDDRQKSNYLMKNENGHVSNKKIRLTYKEEVL